MASTETERYTISFLLVLGFESTRGVASVTFNYIKVSSHS